MNRNHHALRHTRRWGPALLSMIACCILPNQSQAATPIKVTTAIDAQHYQAACTLRDAVENVTSRNQDGSTACPAGTGDDSIIFEGVNTIALDPMLGEIEIGEDVKLQIRGGAGNVQLNGQLATRIFRINGAGTRVYFNNIHFRDANAMSGGRGGAVYVDGARTVDFIDVRFDNNSAATGGGGLAVDGNGTNLGLLDTVFFQNQSLGDENGDNGFGGALDITGTINALVFNTDFGFNQARSGGAIHCETGGTKTMLAITGGMNGKEKGTFEGNIAWAPNSDLYGPNGGGAIYNRCPIRVISTRFVRNFALGKGAGIYHASGGHAAFIDNTVFRDNAFLEASDVEGNGLGGAIASEGPIEVQNSSFTGNTASRGAALHIRGTQDEEVLIANSSILKNTAWDTGAGIFFQGAVNVAGIWNLTIQGNTGMDSFHFDKPGSGAEVDVNNTIIMSTGNTANCGGDLHAVHGGPSNLQRGDPSIDTCLFVGGMPFGDPGFGSTSQASYFPYTSYLPISSAADAAQGGDTLVCKELGRDQIGQPRNVLACSIGAVEPF